MAGPEISKLYVPLTCHGHSRPVTHLSFSDWADDGDIYYLISACKGMCNMPRQGTRRTKTDERADNQPMLRDGVTGDWIGTFGHKGAIYQARLSADANIAASASADFTTRVWDTHSGETLCTLQHNHTVRAIAFPPTHNTLIATGGMEKKLRIFDFSRFDPNAPNPAANGTNGASEPMMMAEEGFEIGAGVHQGCIKAIVWTRDPNILVTVADDKKIRWWDLGNQGAILQEKEVQGDIGSCEFTTMKPEPNDIGHGFPVLCIAAGKSVYFYGGEKATQLIKTVNLPYDVASVALHPCQRKFVTGGLKDTWAKVYNFDTEEELDVHKGHHGPIWSVAFSPDGKLYATGSEDGTIKMWKNCRGPYGLWKADRE
ncbi:Serine-threonine kinase receptor-associated protein [Lachnellula cervina]|uniref:Serine-threonine kinase receptor-associated protein n=1 Tax=Lachnellula cervina TaxID=1316786 RepID=A0A7D8YVY6_9HELO|nr:Serine-threonine kinase receptor-associated protein [Lachnellula cervina]